MTDAKTVINNICSGIAGINLQTIIKDPRDDDYISNTVFRDDETAEVRMRFDARNILVTLIMQTDEEYEHILEALERINGYEIPDDGRELLNIITFIPGTMDGNIVTYASAYLGLFFADDDSFAVHFIFPRDDFAVFALDTDQLAVDEGDIDEDKVDNTEEAGE